MCHQFVSKRRSCNHLVVHRRQANAAQVDVHNQKCCSVHCPNNADCFNLLADKVNLTSGSILDKTNWLYGFADGGERLHEIVKLLAPNFNTVTKKITYMIEGVVVCRMCFAICYGLYINSDYVAMLKRAELLVRKGQTERSDSVKANTKDNFRKSILAFLDSLRGAPFPDRKITRLEQFKKNDVYKLYAEDAIKLNHLPARAAYFNKIWRTWRKEIVTRSTHKHQFTKCDDCIGYERRLQSKKLNAEQKVTPVLLDCTTSCFFDC